MTRYVEEVLKKADETLYVVRVKPKDEKNGYWNSEMLKFKKRKV